MNLFAAVWWTVVFFVAAVLAVREFALRGVSERVLFAALVALIVGTVSGAFIMMLIGLWELALS